MNIQKRILLWFLIPSVLMTIIVSAFYYFYTRKTIEQNILDRLEITAEALEENVHIFLKAKRGRVIDFSSDGFIKDTTEKITMPGSMLEYYTSALNNHLVTNKKPLDPSIHEVLVVDFEDKVVASTDEGRIGKVVSTERFFTEEMFSGVLVGDSYYDTRLKTFLIDFSTMLLTKIGREPIGFIINRIKIGQRGDRIRDGKSAVQDSEKDYSKSIAANITRIIDFSSDGFIRDYTEEIVRRDEKAFYYTDLLNTFLYANKQPLDPDILSVFVVNLDGEVVSSTEIGQIGRNVSGEAYFTKTMKSGSFIGDLRYPQGLRQNAFFYAARVFISDRVKEGPIGIIVNRYRGDYLEMVTHNEVPRTLRKVGQLEGLGETGELYIVNSDKLMITESRFIKDAVFKQVVDTEGVRTAFENGRGMIGIYPDYRGILVLGASRYLEEMDWVLLAENDASEAFAPLVYLRNFTVIMGVLSIMVIVAVAVYISKGITRPIRKLVTYTHNITKGDLTKQIRIKSKDELGSLAGSFDTMRIKLRKSFQNIEDAKQDWESTFDSVKDIIVLYNKDYKIIRCNKELLSRLKARSEDIIGKKCYEVFNHDEKERNEHIRECEVIKTVKTLKPSTIEKESTTLHGIFLFSTFLRFNYKGEFTGVIQILRNITKRKRAEEELKKYRYHLESLVEKRTRELRDSQEALVRSEKLAVLGKFAGGVAHELRNPLGVINNSIYFLKMILPDADDKVREYLEKISFEVKLSTEIISGILDFSRIQPTYEKEEVAVTNMLTLALERLPAPENIEVRTAIPSDLPAVYVDPKKIGQVLFNLMSNGYQAMPEGGRLTITASAEKQYVNISIADSGTGISPENMKKIFEPLFTTKARGIGFGLALSRNLVESNGGIIEVKSEEGKGATFTLKLPVRRRCHER